MEYVDSESIDVTNGTNSSTGPHSQERPFMARLLSNSRVTAEDHWQDVRLIRLDITGSGIK